MNHPNNMAACENCLHTTIDEAKKLVCLATSKVVAPDYSCENFSPDKRDSQEIAQFGFEAEKDYVTTKLYNLFIAYLIGVILGPVLIFIGYTDPREHLAIIVIGVLIMLISSVIWMVFLYNVWEFTINELKKHGIKPHVEAPGKAVGYLFIPFYNFYWVFMAIGKLPVDMNRIAFARKGKHVIANEIGLVLCILTILTIIPIVGIFLALINMVLLPVFFFLAISAIKNIPYSPETVYVEKSPEAEPLDINTVRDYSLMFDKKRYGLNLMFGLYYFLASFGGQVISIVIFYVNNHISLWQYFVGINLLYTVLAPLLYAMTLVMCSHAIRNKVWLAIVLGLFHVLINVIPPSIMILMNGIDFHLIFNKGFMAQIISNFLNAALFILSISAFIRLFGLKFWSILLSLAVTGILTHASYYGSSYLFEGNYQFRATNLVGLVVYTLLSSMAIYFAFNQYIQRTKRASE